MVIAVGLVVAIALGTLIKVFTDNIITLLVNRAGGGGTTGLGVHVKRQLINFGAFISAVIDSARVDIGNKRHARGVGRDLVSGVARVSRGRCACVGAFVREQAREQVFSASKSWLFSIEKRSRSDRRYLLPRARLASVDADELESGSHAPPGLIEPARAAVRTKGS
ncbi:MAG: hypothetical protein ACXVHJ_29055 [Solirubrobacteraceae bacterium]